MSFINSLWPQRAGLWDSDESLFFSLSLSYGKFTLIFSFMPSSRAVVLPGSAHLTVQSERMFSLSLSPLRNTEKSSLSQTLSHTGTINERPVQSADPNLTPDSLHKCPTAHAPACYVVRFISNRKRFGIRTKFFFFGGSQESQHTAPSETLGSCTSGYGLANFKKSLAVTLCEKV